jgi:hypothetical protein
MATGRCFVNWVILSVENLQEQVEWGLEEPFSVFFEEQEGFRRRTGGQRASSTLIKHALGRR